jgi:hypothetical protein
MPAINDSDKALTTARFGAMRFGAFRFGYTPRDTVTAAGVDGGPQIHHDRVYPPAVTYTLVKS